MSFEWYAIMKKEWLDRIDGYEADMKIYFKNKILNTPKAHIDTSEDFAQQILTYAT